MFLSVLSQTQKEAIFRLAHNVVVSDGELTAGEEAMMEEIRLEMGLSPDYVPSYLEVEGMQHVFDTHRVRVIVLITLIRMGYADGAFEIEEQCFIQDLCSLFGMNGDHLARIENWVRRLVALEAEAKELL